MRISILNEGRDKLGRIFSREIIDNIFKEKVLVLSGDSVIIELDKVVGHIDDYTIKDDLTVEAELTILKTHMGENVLQCGIGISRYDSRTNIVGHGIVDENKNVVEYVISHINIT